MKRYRLTTSAALLAGLLLVSSIHAKSPDELRTAAEKGEPQAQFELARGYLRGEGLPQDSTQALEWMKKAAAAGYADAIGGLGYFYSSGTVVPKDDAKAFELFKNAAEKGSAKAQFNLGRMLAKGVGTAINEDEGLKWIERAAAQGLADAQYVLAEIAYSGQHGRKVDYPLALAIALKAAQQGHLGAQNLVGVIYQHGFAGKLDEAEAEKWLRKAAIQGDAKAQSNLGHLLGPESPDLARRKEALTWLFIASRQKEPTALRKIELLHDVFPADQFTAPEAEAAKFQPTPEPVKR